MQNATEQIAKLQEQSKGYFPLIVIVVFSALIPLGQKILGHTSSVTLMYGFMGYFLIFLSMFKFFDLPGFVKGFAKYDLVTQKFPVYGYVYPFIELFLGLAYLSHFILFLTSLLTIIVMSIGAVGVFKSLKSGEDIKCACLGTGLNVPLSTVSIVENVGMVVMAVLQIVRHLFV
ncbi:MAG: MauE/DoxX family redox-associated membrane protein [Gammaproteobacteria bacterium]